MISVSGTPVLGTAMASVTQGRGLNADELTDMCMDKLLHVADTAPPAIREQAAAFKGDIRKLVHYYISQAQRSQNTSIYNVLMQAGQHDAAEVVRKL